MIEHGKTRVWRLDDLLPAKEPERAQPVGRNDGSSSERRIQPQRVVVIQPNTLPTSVEHEQPCRLAPQAQPAGPRARHTAEAWAAGANIGAKTELRRNDAEIMKAVAQARARRTEEASASSIVIPKMPAAAKLALLRDWLIRQPKPRVLIAGAMTLTLGIVPLLLRASDDVSKPEARENLVAPAPPRAAKQDSPGEANEAAHPSRLAAAAPPASAKANEPVRSAAASRAWAEASGAARSTPLPAASSVSAEADEAAGSTQPRGAAQRASAQDNEAAGSKRLPAAAQAAPIEASAAAWPKPHHVLAQLEAATQVPPEPTQLAGSLLPIAAGDVTPRMAIDALISGHPSLAAARYQALARSHPERAELAAAARILREETERAALSGE